MSPRLHNSKACVGFNTTGHAVLSHHVVFTIAITVTLFSLALGEALITDAPQAASAKSHRIIIAPQVASVKSPLKTGAPRAATIQRV